MSLTKKLEQMQMGILQPSTFRDSVRSQRMETLRPSLYRSVVCAWTPMDCLPGMYDGNDYSVGYVSIDIDKRESRYLLAGCANGCLEIFDLDPVSRSPVQKCPRIISVQKKSSHCHKSSCNWVQWYSKDNGIFVTSSHDKTVKIWDANESVAVETFAFNMPVFMHQLAGDAANGGQRENNLIAVASDESNVRFADIRTGDQSRHLSGYHKEGVVCVQWSPYDSNILLTAGRDGRLLSWDIRSGKTFLKALVDPRCRKHDVAHDQAIVAMKFAPCQEYLRFISLDSEGELKIWDAFTFNLVKRVATRFRCNARTLKAIGVDFACHNVQRKEHNYLFIPVGAGLDIISLSDGRTVQTLSTHMMPSYSCAYRGPDYQELYTASFDKTIGCFRPEHDENPHFRFNPSGTEIQKPRQRVVALTQDNWSDSDSD